MAFNDDDEGVQYLLYLDIFLYIFKINFFLYNFNVLI
jgi:hypothetical protein